LWGTTHSNIQNLYVAEVSSAGSMTKGWHFKGTAIQVGEIGHGPQTNSIAAASGLHRMLDNAHIAVMGGFKGNLTLPDGTEWGYAKAQTSAAYRTNLADQAPFVMKLDVSKAAGIGAGTTGWAKEMDGADYPGGADLYSVDGDASGNMIVSLSGCASYDPTAMSYDGFGRPVMGAKAGCVNYLTKLAAADGAEVWKTTLPHSLSSCRTISDGSIFCGWTTGAETLDFGNSVTLTTTGQTIGIVKFSAAGVAQWAKSTLAANFGDLSVNSDGTLLAAVGSDLSSGQPAHVVRIDTSSGNEGNILWSDPGGVGTHGFRGVEVTADPTASTQEVQVFGQVTGIETLTDTGGASTTLRSRGSYEVFVAAYKASDGSGKYAMDGGGTGMEYFFAFAKDPSTQELYVGGTSRSETIWWGNVKRTNAMYDGDSGENNPKTSRPVGSSKAFVVKLASVTELPECLTTCNSGRSMIASDVKSGYCYIDRYCYANGEAAPYAGAGCYSCDASNPLQWSGPDTTNHCFFGGTCYAANEAKQISAGRSYVDSECQTCQPAHTTQGWSMVDGYMLTTSGACHKKTPIEEAVRLGYRPPCASARRRLKALEAESPGASMPEEWLHDSDDDDESPKPNLREDDD